MKSRDDAGKLVLRLVLGGLMLFHGTHKLLHGIAPIVGMVTSHGLPALFAYGVLVGEVVAPILILAGYYARLGGLLVVVNMVVAVLLAHAGQLFALAPSGGWQLELQAFYLFSGLLVFLFGAGRYSLRSKGRWS
ncbi:MAG: DoxX family protein [Deltaproteobacteria bacterium]|nr:DoxX family protein [Deltaproteobacteria bacterium]